jgi:leucyl-tRNA synthetase
MNTAENFYPFGTIEPKWQKIWDEKKIYQCTEDEKFPREKRFYCLDMFPYPSGAGLHVGHPEGYTASDILCRYKRMNGFNVLHPMGWDAFGLPTENYALKTGLHPATATRQNIENFKRQIKALGFSYDWGREIDTTDPNYYKWTQWIFLQLFKHGLAYQTDLPINWCPSCRVGLANEEVKDGRCERCGEVVGKKNLRQWLLKITAYAERLLDDLDLLDWPEQIKIMQRNWIGKSIGAEVDFKIDGHPDKTLRIFTSRPDTLFGVTFMVLAPEHLFVEEITTEDNLNEVQEYVEKARQKSDLERAHLEKVKTGVFTGAYAINPVNDKKIPVYVADYVLASYGTGAIMSVPAHDERDFEFAKKFNLPIIQVVSRDGRTHPIEQAYIEDGFAINSGEYSGMSTEEFKEKITSDLEKKGLGKKAVNYKLRDWVFSRQRYWGEPIPIIHCPKCGQVPLPEVELPLKLPKVEKYAPTTTGESPLANIKEWVATRCPKCGGAGKRETNTMPQWAGSSWYYLRYIDPQNDRELANKKKSDYWLPVNHYIGGAEHAVLHLLYARFWHKFLYDIGLVATKEPFLKLTNQGLILAEDGRKMSKSLGNVINPDDVIKNYGADTMRIYEMFMGPLEMAKPWSTKSIQGVKRFLDKVWRLYTEKEILDSAADEMLERLAHKTIKKVGEDIKTLNLNTAISAMMIFVNDAQKAKKLNKKIMRDFLKLLAPFAPHLAEELWEKLGHKTSIHLEKWPEYDLAKIAEGQMLIVIQVNGRVRDKITVAADISEDDLKKQALVSARIKEILQGKTPEKVIVVPRKLVNIVLK